jgi:hypothetical protein
MLGLRPSGCEPLSCHSTTSARKCRVNDATSRQRFDELGNRVGNEFLVSVGDGSQRLPVVARASDFVVVWQSSDEDNIVGQRFDAQGAKAGDPFVVNTFTDNQQEVPAIASDAQGNFVVVWGSFPDGEGKGIFARRFDANGAAVASS